MKKEIDTDGFQSGAKFSLSSIFSLGGKMSENGSDKAGENISVGIKVFLILGVILAFCFGIASLHYDYKKTELTLPAVPQSSSPSSPTK